MSAQDGIKVLGKANRHSTSPLSSLPKVTLEKVLMMVWSMVTQTIPDQGGWTFQPLSSTTLVSSWRSVLGCSSLLTIRKLFCSILGCVLPLQEVAIHQSPPIFYLHCSPSPYRFLLPHNVISPTKFRSSNWSYTLYQPLCASNDPSIVFQSRWHVQPISISLWLCIRLCLSLCFFA